MATSYLNMMPAVFWDLTPYDWKLVLDGIKIRQEQHMLEMGMQCWHNGLAAQADLGKIGYPRWMDSFSDPEKVKARHEKEMSEGAKLWEQMNKGK